MHISTFWILFRLITYFTRIDSILHDAILAFSGDHFKKCEHGINSIIKISSWILPFSTHGEAVFFAINLIKLGVRKFLSTVESSLKEVYSHNCKYQKENQSFHKNICHSWNWREIAFTTILSPLFLLTILSGLNARIALRAFNLLKLPVSVSFADSENPKSTKELTTTKKSSAFQAFRI
jgi:hypothetical protein